MKSKILFEKLIADCTGNFAILTALVIPVLLVCAGGAVDISGAIAYKEHLQQKLDAAVLASAKETTYAAQLDRARRMMVLDSQYTADMLDQHLQLKQNSDGSLTGIFEDDYPANFLQLIGKATLNIAVRSTAFVPTGTTSSACIHVLASSGQDALINSGANVQASTCEMDVASTANPAFIMNSDSTLNFSKFCVKGTHYIKNGGTINNMQVGCTTPSDPYAGKLVEPTVTACTDSGTMDGNNITVQTGVHCNLTFNGSPKITFKPGLHIISGRMIINSGATVVANGVTFYFPDTDSEIRANGDLTFTGVAPDSGTYKGILMFEKTSDRSNNANKTQYIFNGSNGETLKGVIYLPNRNVTYNSTTNVAAQISMVVNQIIINSARWNIQPYSGPGSSSVDDSNVILLN